MNHSSINYLSMDGSSVNHKFCRHLKEYCEREKLPKMINLGSCNCHAPPRGNIHFAEIRLSNPA